MHVGLFCYACAGVLTFEHLPVKSSLLAPLLIHAALSTVRVVADVAASGLSPERILWRTHSIANTLANTRIL